MIKTYMARIFALALLMMVSMGVRAEIEVKIGTFTGGTITATQETVDSKVTVTLIVTPDKNKGYKITKKDIYVYATISPNGTRVDGDPTIDTRLELDGDDPKDLSEERKYSVTVADNFGVWVKEANFVTDESGSKNRGGGLSGVYYIGTVGYDFSSPSNNYYLCPTESWIYYKPTNDWSTDGTANPNPFLTTYKCKTNAYHSGNASNAVWIIEKHPTEDYYYIIHANTGKYMVSNGQISGTTNANRMRVHLETVAQADLDDKELFSIEPYSTYLVISPKSEDGWNKDQTISGKKQDLKWYTVNGGNQNKLVGNGSNGGPTGYTATGGVLGVYTQNDANAKFYLEVISPTIGYNSSGQIVISHPSATTFYYTLDGSDPTTSSTPYTEPITLSEGITTVKAIAVDPSNAVSHPTTFMAFNLDGSHSYLIQSLEFDYYYMIPNLSTETANDSQDRLTTNSLARPSMQWYFEDAGMDNGVQYYYIKNLATGNPQYIYYLSDNTIRWNDGKVITDAIVDDAYKFSFVESTYGGYTIRPKLKQNYWLRKGGGSKSNNHIAASNSDADKGYSRWTFISYNGSVPNTATPITASVGDNKQYYKIASEAEPTYFIVTPTSPATVVTTTTTESENTVWYFEEASHDEWLTYYYIGNAKSNEYLYLARTGDNALEMKATPTDDGKCLFAIAKSATDGLYIVPESKKYDGARVYWSLSKQSGKDAVRAASTRWWNDTNGNDNVIKWIFTETTLRCTKPVIAYSESDNGYMITGANSTGEKIYYTLTGEDPTISSSLEYDGSPILMSSLSPGTVIKAIVAKNEDATTISEMASVTIEKVETPVIQDNGNNAIEITCATAGATIYYTTDGTPPTSASTVYSTPLTDVSGKVIKAIAVKGGYIDSEVATSGTIKFACATPVIKKNDQTSFTITCSNPTEGVTIYYTLADKETLTDEAFIADPVNNGIAYPGSAVTTTFPQTIRAIAIAEGYSNSAIAERTIGLGLSGTGTAEDPYEIDSDADFTTFVEMVNDNGTTYSDYTGCAAAQYKLTSNVSASGSSPIETAFTGVFDGDLKTISDLDHALFNSVEGGTVKNVILVNVQISGSGPVGGIAGTASDYSRIYNCGILPSSNKYDAQSETSFLKSSGGTNSYCGGLVGWLKDDSRVINCFSYANITGGTDVAGIVGHNEAASNTTVSDGKYANLRTAVVNCMFYGNLSGGTNTYPVYGGAKMANNAANGINNYDYYRAEASVGTLTDYNCSWPAKEENLTQYEFYRNLLNSNRELCGWWVGAPSAPSTMTTTEVQAVPKDASLMAKWVLDPSIAPYPVLKPAGKYFSVVNQDPNNRINPNDKKWVSRSTSSNTIMSKAAPDTEGQKLGSVTVNIYKGGGLTGSDSKPIPITAMDIENNDFCYGKIQLPYYNSIFGNPDSDDWDEKYGGNYKDQVVVGWTISATGGVANVSNQGEHVFSTDAESGYNFADRYCTTKDENRVFAQGGYYYVPYGVSEITITAKWATATYLSNNERYYDRISVSSYTYDTAIKADVGSATLYPFEPAGQRSETLGNGKTVASGVISAQIPTGSVYGNAIVLVGNHQQFTGDNHVANNNKYGCTIMSADFDLDEEPDNCLIWELGNKTSRYDMCPIRFDFLPVVEMGMAMKEDGSTQYYALGCYRPLGHFEVTETSLIHFGQFEFSTTGRTTKIDPLILNGGIFDQYTKGTAGNAADKDCINYIIIGGNVRMPSFTPGAHPSTRTQAIKSTRHCPVNVMGGNIDYLYLSGNYNDNITPNKDNPHCYIDGGNFKQVAAAGKEGIDGNVYFKIDHSVIQEFYGGSTMDQSDGNNFKTVKGNIDVTIDNSMVTKYCGGPKFGSMLSDKTVTTRATGTTFGVYYGGGNGGTSYVQYASTDITNNNAATSYDWNHKDKGNLTNYNPGSYYKENSTDAKGIGYKADYDMEIVNPSTGTVPNQAIFRTYFYAAQFSATNTGSITNDLTDCKVLTNFYGGGNLGGVKGDVTSTLSGSTRVDGSVFGAGYSASIPEVTIYNKDKTPPTINVYTGIITPTPEGSGTSTTYTWTHETSLGGQTLSTTNPTVTVGDKNYFYTEVNLDNLGSVSGTVTLNIIGATTVGKSVYGGGEESGVDGNTEVNVTGGKIGDEATVYEDLVGNVYGGGRGLASSVTAGQVKGNTKVTIEGDAESPYIRHNVYGGGALGSVGEFDYDNTTGIPTRRKDGTSGGTCEVFIKGGKIGLDGHNNGMVNGSSRGNVSAPDANGVDIYDHLAWVYDTHVVIGDPDNPDNRDFYDYPLIKGSVYGSGENGHTYHKTIVDVHSGTIGVAEEVGLPDNERYIARGNVYGSGCGTDTYTVDGKTYYNLNAGIVLGTTEVNIDGGHVVRNVYGAGSMASVGTFTLDANKKPVGCTDGTGITNVNISGGLIGNYNGKMNYPGDGIGPDDFGHVFGAGRGELQDSTVYVNMALTGYVNKTHVTISDGALITGSVYGGGECGHVLKDTDVKVEGGQIGVGEGKEGPYSESDWANTSLAECAHWPYEPPSYSPFDKYSGDSDYNIEAAAGGAKKATNGHTFYGNVFGGGSGFYPYAPGKWVRSAGLVEGNTNVTITGGHILSNVYGGNEHTDVYGKCTVNMSGGTVGVPLTYAEKTAHPVTGNVYGAGKGDKRVLFNTWTNVKETEVNISGEARIYGSVLGGGEDGHVLKNAVTNIGVKVTDNENINDNILIGTLGTTGYDGNVFGGGRGSYTALTAGVVCGNTEVNIWGGTMMGSVYGGGRLSSVGTYLVPPTEAGASATENPKYGKLIPDGKEQIIKRTVSNNQEVMVNEDDDKATSARHGHTVVNIMGGTIGAFKEGKLVNSSFSTGDVFGACKGTTNGDFGTSYYTYDDVAQVKLGVCKSAIVNMLGGTVGNSIYGGGELGNIGTATETTTTTSADKFFAKVNLLGGSVVNVYGGGLGKKKVGNIEGAETLVMGDVKVNLNGLEAEDYDSSVHGADDVIVKKYTENTNSFYRVKSQTKGCEVSGTIFGCNNLNGTPQGHAKVHVFMTRPKTGQAEGAYDVAAVYGGGNQADYVPVSTDTQQKTEVIIEGCDLTSIQQVYGGGNAAATPGTLVTIKGTKIIDEVFGGGNGVSSAGFDNPGANVGFRTDKSDYTSGDGKSLVQLMAGHINNAYGGSNTKGDIRGGSNVVTVDNEYVNNATACCKDLDVGYMFGGGKNASMKSGANIILGCSNSNLWVKEIYAGAENADVEGNCSLTITSGKFGRVFGGNKTSGVLKGSITVNIEENGQCGIPIIIGELYGGGNKAAYSVYGYNANGSVITSGSAVYDSPVVNVKACTSIGNIFGGGYGEEAVMYGSPTVNINEVTISHTDNDNTFSGNAYGGETIHFVDDILYQGTDWAEKTGVYNVTLPAHDDGEIGAIGNVFGGGNAAAVYGDTQVNIGTTAKESLVILKANGEPDYEVVNGVTTTQPKRQELDVVGADIRGNVYGGGNQAIVSGNTNVNIGKEGTTTQSGSGGNGGE